MFVWAAAGPSCFAITCCMFLPTPRTRPPKTWPNLPDFVGFDRRLGICVARRMTTSRVPVSLVTLLCFLNGCVASPGDRSKPTANLATGALAPPGSTAPTAVNPPTEPSTAAQASFDNPVSNTGAFVQQVPFAFPTVIAGLSPELGLSYSHQSGMGLAGVGWDMPLASITLNTGRGTRPETLDQDVARYAEGEVVERYASNLGPIAVRRQGSVDTVFLTQQGAVAVEFSGDDVRAGALTGGDPTSFVLRSNDGRVYRYGSDQGTSIYSDARSRKVMWLLAEVEDASGNKMRYRYEEFPGGREVRQPVLRAIEYTVPSGQAGSEHLYVVKFSYQDSSWKRAAYNLGTRIDFAKLLSSACLYSDTSAVSSTPGGKLQWNVRTHDSALYCYRLSYLDHGESFTGRPLLQQVYRESRDGTRTEYWSFDYDGTGLADGWYEGLRATVEHDNHPTDLSFARRDPTNPADPTRGNLPISRDVNSGQDLTMFDANGDGIVEEFRRARTDGRVEVLSPAGIQVSDHPLRGAQPMRMTPQNPAALDDHYGCWQRPATVALAPSSPGRLGYAKDLTKAPVQGNYRIDWAEEYDPAHAGGVAPLESDECESTAFGTCSPSADMRDLGMFGTFSSAFSGTVPRAFRSAGDGDLVVDGLSIDEFQRYGGHADGVNRRQLFDPRVSDCGRNELSSPTEVDFCWALNGASRTGSLGSLGCFDAPGPRALTNAYAATSGLFDAQSAGYGAELWSLKDVNGDGFEDWVFAAPVILADQAGVIRNLQSDKDWYVSLWDGSAGTWASPVRWTVPNVPGLDGLGLIQTTAYRGQWASPTWGVGISAGVSVSGYGVSLNLITPVMTVGVLGYGGGFGGSGGLSVLGAGVGDGAGAWAQDFATGVAMNVGSVALGSTIGMMTQGQGLGFANQTGMTSASNGVGALVARSHGGNAAARNSLMPSASLGLSWSNSDGLKGSFSLPIIGDIFHLGDTESSWSPSYQLQGIADLDGDGLGDLVATQFDGQATWADYHAGAPLVWKVFLNGGTGFSAPIDWSLASPLAQERTDPSEHSQYFGAPAGSLGAMYTRTDVLQMAEDDSCGDGIGNFGIAEPHPYGHSRNVRGLVDLNADGLLDYVDTMVHAETGNPRQWNVYFNTGRGFGPATPWAFDVSDELGHRREPVEEATGIFYALVDQPRISTVVYGTHNGPDPGVSNVQYASSRQVQGLFDFNQDGLLDYFYENPVDLLGNDEGIGQLDEGANVEWGYYPWDFAHANPEARNAVDPDKTYRSVFVFINNGSGFTAVDLLPAGSVPLNASMVLNDSQTNPSNRATLTSSITADVNNDGQLDLATVIDPTDGLDRCGALFHQDAAGQVTFAQTKPYRVRSMGRATADFMTSVTTPFGGTISTAYKFEKEQNGDMGRGVWVLDTITAHDATQTIGVLDPPHTRKFVYDHGNYDRARQSFLGFERVYQIGLPADQNPSGYTVTRYYQGAGFDGLTYCREVRQVDVEAEYRSATGLEERVSSLVTELDTFDRTEAGGAQGTALPALAAHLNRADTEPRALTTPRTTAATSREGLISSATLSSTLWSSVTAAGRSGSIEFTRTPAEALALAGASSCARSTDPGVSMQRDFSVAQDHSSLARAHATRLVATRKEVFGEDGTRAAAAETSIEVDSRGNVIAIIDRGDVSIPDDDVFTTQTLAPTATGTNYLSGFPCTVRVFAGVDVSGTLASATAFGYDGRDSSVCLSVTPTRGLPTSTVERVDATQTRVSTTGYNSYGLVTAQTQGGVTKTVRFGNSQFPFVPTGEALRAGGRTRVTATFDWYGIGSTDGQPRFGLLRSLSDENGQTTTFDYDNARRIKSVVKPGASVVEPSIQFEYGDDQDHLRLSSEDRSWSSTSILIAGGQRAVKTVYLDGFGREERTESTAPIGSSTYWPDVVASEIRYDGGGRPIQSSAPYAQWAAGNRPDGEASVFQSYDLLGRVTRTIGYTGAEIVHRYDGLVQQVFAPQAGGALGTDVRRSVRSERVDMKGRVVEKSVYVQNGALLHSSYVSRYDAAGNLVEVTGPQGLRWTREYDLLGRQTGESDPNGTDTYAAYNSQGQVATEWDLRNGTNGNVVSYFYDAFGRLTGREERRDAVVSPNGRASGGTVAARATYNYDSYTVIGNGVCSSSDSAGRLTETKAEQRVGARMMTVSTKTFCYDERGQIVRQEQTIAGRKTYRFELTYAPDGQMESLTWPDLDGTGPDSEIRLTSRFGPDGSRDEQEILDKTLGPSPFAWHTVVGRTVTGAESRSRLGAAVRVRCFESSVNNPSVLRYEVIAGAAAGPCLDSGSDTFSPVFGLPVGVEATDRDAVRASRKLFELGLRHDADGRIGARQTSGPSGQTSIYEYDDVGQLTGDLRNPGWVSANQVAYGYDSLCDYYFAQQLAAQGGGVAWNLLRPLPDGFDATKCVSPPSPVQPIAWQTAAEAYDYDAVGNLTSYNGRVQEYGDVTRSTSAHAGPHAIVASEYTPASARSYGFEYDDAGQVSSWTDGVRTYAYEWTVSGRIASVSSSGVSEIYLYDEDGTRVGRLEPSGRRSFFSMGLIREFEQAGQPTVRESLFSSVGLRRWTSSNPYEPQYEYFAQDQVGNVVGTFDRNAQRVSATEYNAWGDITHRSGWSDVNDITWNAQMRELFYGQGNNAPDVYDHGARTYLADVGRWMSLDPLTEDGWNRYMFVRNDPVNLGDPTGMCGEEAGEPCSGWDSFMLWVTSPTNTNPVTLTGTDDGGTMASVDTGTLARFWMGLTGRPSGIVGRMIPNVNVTSGADGTEVELDSYVDVLPSTPGLATQVFATGWLSTVREEKKYAEKPELAAKIQGLAEMSYGLFWAIESATNPVLSESGAACAPTSPCGLWYGVMERGREAQR